MMKQTHPHSPRSAAASIEFVTLEDVKRIVERRLCWYGRADITVVQIARVAAGAIEATIIDRKRNETYRHVFESIVTVAHGADPGRPSLAA